MIPLPRFIREWAEPLRKCRRVGHDVPVKIGIAAGGVQGLFQDFERHSFCRRCFRTVTVYGWLKED